MKRKSAIVGLFAAAILLVGAAAAFAGDINGTGHTPLNAALGFNAKSDLSGQLNYNADPNGPNAGFSAHCDGYTHYRVRTSPDGFPAVNVTANCTDKDGVAVNLRANFVDRGEPGTSDSVCIEWRYSPKVVYIWDYGTILNGNIQYHGTDGVEILDSP
jgi:hypothetical protein